MTVIAFVHSKGGTGKSTLVCNLTLFLAHHENKRVAILDIDPQESSEAFAIHINHPNIAIWDSDASYDYVLVDTPGGITDEELGNVAAQADHILIPFTLSPFEVDSTNALIERIDKLDKTHLLLNKVRVSTSVWKNRRRTLSTFPVKALKAIFRLREAYNSAITEGWNDLTPDAVKELKALTKEINKL